MQRAELSPGDGAGAGGCQELIPSRNGGTWAHTEGKKRWESTKSLLLCSGAPEPAPPWAPSPPQGAGVGTHSFGRMQRAQTAWKWSLERKTTSKSGQKCKRRGFQPGEDTREKLELMQEQTSPLQSCVQGFILYPFYSHRGEPIGGTIKASPSWGFRAGQDLDAPGTFPNS